ncbi:methyltransferase domain-containing protein [Mesorhizobium sp. LMG 17147]|uniref:protein-L-isoaspartate O-methyltransferase family protein n=1 Tax=Mesorhizobium sp. LMG 17147 TaxID=2963091 RepID=UPI0020C9D90D|nr:methyltransferase domain-containing protein [Mesorhizobium sp. LMG 17147]MCP9233134.1 methyltransferase domain-containing protein [Mesorhizobium sp. LMG 17147]
MPTRSDASEARRWFAEDLRVSSPVLHNPAVIEAFAKVPREHYLGSGPWRIHSRLQIGAVHTSPSAALHEIYHDVLVSLDEKRGLNSGLPSLWALVFDHVNIAPGQTVLQVGAGVGYFTALLAELTGSEGRVIAYEIDEELARRAQSNLAHYAHVEVVSGDATHAVDLPDLDVVVAFAGVTHVPERWLSNLSDAGRMALPFTGEDQRGFMMLLERAGDTFPVRPLVPCGFYPCSGARRIDEEKALKAALKGARGKVTGLAQYHRGRPANGIENAWLVTETYWISKA